MQTLPAWASDRRRSRQDVIGTRRCRQRLAQGLAAGRSPKALAALNRLGEAEVELLLKDEGFQDLVAHYRTLAELPEAEKLAALRRKALELMELALDAGDVRVAIFFAYEELHGRDPGLTLAKAAVRAVEREAVRTAPPPERRLPLRPPFEPPKREADFPWCAATQAGPTEAAAMAAGEVRRFEARIGTTRRGLTGRLLAEAEREGTAKVEPLTAKVKDFACEAHGEGGKALGAAAQWQERRDAFAAGRVVASRTAAVATATFSTNDAHSSHRHPGLEPGPSAAAGSCSVRRGSALAGRPAWVPAQARDDGMRRVAGGATCPPPSAEPAQGRHPENAAAGAAVPLGPQPRDGPTAPALPDWVDRVPGASRARLLVMPDSVRTETLRVWARFYGFDTS
jgi:hypothetical protein